MPNDRSQLACVIRRRGDPASNSRPMKWILVTISTVALSVLAPAIARAQTCEQLRSEVQQAAKVYEACLGDTHGPCDLSQKLTWLGH